MKGDIARQGYVNLTAGRSVHPGDSAEMIADRAAFLAEGHYDFIATALAETVRPADGLVLDAGTGTGDYLARTLDALPDAPGLGLDVSKPALRRAARAHPRAAAVLTDLWRPLPVADACATVPPSLNAHTPAGAIAAMYCSPSISYDSGGPPVAPIWNCHSRLPVFAS